MALNHSRHKVILIEILKDIFSNPLTNGQLAFKGGTAAHLFYGLDRFSVDLDFDLLDGTKEELVYEELKSLLARHGKLKLADRKRYSLIYILDYATKTEGDQNVKVEINLRHFGSKYEIKHYLGIPMRVMVAEDMAAHKIVACYVRIGKTNRDLYDSYFFLSRHWEINSQIVEDRTGMSFLEFLNKWLSSVEKMTSRSILAGMGEVLDEKQKAWVKAHLKDELVFRIRLLIDSVKD
jgi:predicted nucleotidyltransferase component of viral defense system